MGSFAISPKRPKEEIELTHRLRIVEAAFKASSRSGVLPKEEALINKHSVLSRALVSSDFISSDDHVIEIRLRIKGLEVLTYLIIGSRHETENMLQYL